ncbi:heme exporter protein CcmD [Brevundimonas sp.]|uniref:heme exporter protein CcmD n=1 Tax=Brevundimonas sp. TaxID=1871086 RepID=UPI002FC8AF5C
MIDLDMGAYAAFVWPAWGISAAVLAGLAVRAVVASRRWNAELKQLDKDAPEARAGIAPQK